MEDRAVVHRPGQVGGKAAARSERKVEAQDAAVVVEAHVPRILERVPLAGRAHVVVAVEAKLGRAPVAARNSAATHANSDICVSLPPKPPPMRRHSTTTSCALMRERVRDHLLHFAGMLRGRVDLHAAAFARHGQRDLAFEVEMVLRRRRARFRAADAARTVIAAAASPRVTWTGGNT